MTTDSANSERERLARSLERLADACVNDLEDEEDMRAAAAMIRADASLRTCVSRKDEEIEGLRAERDWMRRNASLAYSQWEAMQNG